MIYYFGNAFVFMKCKFYWVKLRAAMKKSLDFLIEIFSHRDLKWFRVIYRMYAYLLKGMKCRKTSEYKMALFPIHILIEYIINKLKMNLSV